MKRPKQNGQPGHLVFTRKRGEAVAIHYPKPDGTTGRILVELVNFKGANAAKLGITADPDVEIWREEIEPKPGEPSARSKALAVG